MKRKSIWFLLPLLYCMAVLGTCHLENKADPFADDGEMFFIHDLLAERAAFETAVLARAQGVFESETDPDIIAAKLGTIQQERHVHVDYEFLKIAYEEGLLTLITVINYPLKYDLLNDILNGRFDAQGNVVKKGAAQYLNDDPDKPGIITSEADLIAFFDYQRSVDNLTRQIVEVIEAYRAIN